MASDRHGSEDGTQSLGTADDIVKRQEEERMEPPLRHAMGVCVLSFVAMFQLGAIALSIGHDALGYELAAIAALAIFVFMATWRAYDLLIGKIDDMGILFMAYQNGNELISRISIRILAVLALFEAISRELTLFAFVILAVAVVLPWADSVAVHASYRLHEKQTIDGQESGE